MPPAEAGRAQWLPGVVVPGHGVASGRSTSTPYPAGTIALQAPAFRQHGVDLSAYFPGTLNVDLAPHVPQPRSPVFDGRLRWHGDLEERFLLMAVRLRTAGHEHAGLWYYPHPATKPAHFQRLTVVELLLPWIDGLQAGAAVEVALPPASAS
jgi:hypothetical protein